MYFGIEQSIKVRIPMVTLKIHMATTQGIIHRHYDGLMYEIKTEDTCEHICKDKEMFDFSNCLTK